MKATLPEVEKDMLGKLVLAKGATDYLAHQLFQDLPKAARRRLAQVDWDRDVLNRAGLQRLSTVRRGGGNMAFFLLGALAGGMAALMLAPKAGVELRSQVKSRAQNLMGGVRQGAYPQAPAEA